MMGWCEWPTGGRCHKLAYSMVPVPLCREHSDELNRKVLAVYDTVRRRSISEYLDGSDVKQS
jgi:hypothetical protein